MSTFSLKSRLKLEQLDDRIVPSIVVARHRIQGSGPDYRAFDEVARIDAQGVETLLYSRENIPAESIFDAAVDVHRNGDIAFAFAGAGEAGTTPHLFRFDPRAGTLVSLGSLAPPGSTEGTFIGATDLDIGPDGTIALARTRRPAGSVAHDVVLRDADGGETFLRSLSSGSSFPGAPSVYVASDGDVVYAFAVNDSTYSQGIGREVWRRDAATGGHQVLGYLDGGDYWGNFTINLIDADISLTPNGRAVVARTWSPVSSPSTVFTTVAILNGEGLGETIIDTRPSEGGAHAATVDVLRDGDIVYAFTAPGSGNLIRRWDAQTGVITVIGSLGAGVYDAVSLEFVPDGETPVVAAIGSLDGAPARIHTVDAGGETVLAFQPFDGYDGSLEVARADFTGDEVPDIVAGSGTDPHVKMFNGVDGSELASFLVFDQYLGGISVAAADVNGDGTPDFVVGSRDGSSHVKVFDGRTGSEIASFLAFEDFDGGVTVAAADVDGDGFADIIVGTQFGDCHVKIFGGTDGVELSSFFAFPEGYLGGVSVAAGDWDDDGTVEVVVGSLRGLDHVKVFDGLAETERVSFFAFDFGGGVGVAVLDADADGIADVVAVSRLEARVRAFRPDETLPLRDYSALEATYRGGISIG